VNNHAPYLRRVSVMVALLVPSQW